jgi:serine/threonine protein kinase
LLLTGAQGPVPGSVNIQRVVRTASDIAAAMTYLHGQNVLHGDLNGNNILLVGANPRPGDDRDFLAKVADFGLSRMLAPGECQRVTRLGDRGGREGGGGVEGKYAWCLTNSIGVMARL